MTVLAAARNPRPHQGEAMTLPRYLYGWQCWFRALYMARTKKRGAGPMKWRYAFKMAAAYRFIVDGQQRNPPRLPRYLRKMKPDANR